jgi:uncharacterized oligopeptide transporter (OPT) family protein
MATLIKGILSFNLDWQYVMVGIFISITLELCGIKALAFAIGLYLPLATTLPIFIGGALKAFVDWRKEGKNEKKEEDDLGRGNLFATGLIAGGAISGVVVAVLSVFYFEALQQISIEQDLNELMGENGYQIFGALCFLAMAIVLARVAMKKVEN